MEINFNSIKCSRETHPIHMHSKNIVILAGYETDDVIEKLFNSLLEKYQKELEEKLKKSNFTFDNVGVLYYKLNKTSLDRVDHIQILQNG